MTPGLPATPRHHPVVALAICIAGRSLNRAGSQPIQALRAQRAFGQPDTFLSIPSRFSQLVLSFPPTCFTSSSTMLPPTAPHWSRLFLHILSIQNRLCFTFAGSCSKIHRLCSFSWGWWEKVPTAVPGPSTSNPSLFHGWFSWE